MSTELAISDSEFQQFRALMRKISGIDLGDSKKHLVSGRLSKRVRERGMRGVVELLSSETSNSAAKRAATTSGGWVAPICFSGERAGEGRAWMSARCAT